MIALTPPMVMDAMRDPQITGTTRRMLDWCLLHLDFQQHRPIKRGVLPSREWDKLPRLVALGYIEQRSGHRPSGGENTYRLLWSRALVCEVR